MHRKNNMVASNKRRMGILGRWWYSVDSSSALALFLLIVLGLMLVTTASPAISERIGVNPLYFIHRQILFLLISIPIIIVLSMLNEKYIKRLGFIGLAITIILLIALPFIADEAKGARRWLSLGALSIQPSEFLKPFYTVITAIILAEKDNNEQFPAFTICIIMHIIIMALLLIQPDFGMAITISIVTGTQLFIAGLPYLWILVILVFFILGIAMAYISLPHVAMRKEHFLNYDTTTNYQVKKSLESYINGGLFGKGPGEGIVKYLLPDSHTDFIFAVAGEELGTLFCLLLISLIAFIVIKGILNTSKLSNLYRIYSSIGILMYLAFQAIFNIGVTLHIFPTKGMTLPFVSYGGSSVLSLAIAMGIYFNATRFSNNLDGLNRLPHIKLKV